ncbi:MAG: pyruvate kinase [Gammaproteobacteria bacterium]|nr:pyruvate kinase [Gammaproteobacteria bacterium]
MHNAPIRKTKIVATIGPACDAPDILGAMIGAGMNVARLNLSHGTLAEHHERLVRVRQAAEALGTSVAIMIDTRGIEIRTGRMASRMAELLPGAGFDLYTDGRVGDASGVAVSYVKLPEEVSAGAPVLLDDGAIELEVRSVDAETIHCHVIHGGILGESKSVNLPDTRLSLTAVSPENRDDVIRELGFAAENDVDYIAASFVQSGEDIVRMREILAERDVEIPIIAKIENRTGMTNLEAIVDAADGLMVARGDLGVELPLAEIPSSQKRIIRTTVSRGKPVITATQMLASMEHNPKPTRAEASDVANAILDGSSALMLSGETAVGEYPVKAVETMATLARHAEQDLSEYGYLQTIAPHPTQVVTEAVGQAAVGMADQIKAAAIFSLTETGFTARLVSKHRPSCPILAITGSTAVTRRLCMNWGVLPIQYADEQSDEEKVAFGIERAKALGYLKRGDTVVATAGQTELAGGTNLIRVIEVP